MAIDQATLYLKVRAKTGAATTPSTGGDAISDTNFGYFRDEALRQLSKHLDRRVLTYVTSVKDQHDYVIEDPKPERVHEVLNAASSPLTTDDFLFDSGSVMSGGVAVGESDAGLSLAGNPDQYEVYLQALTHVRRLVIEDWAYRPETGTITVLPAPDTASQRIYYIGGFVYTLANCPAHYEEPLAKYFEAEVLEALAAIRVRVAGVTASGFPSYGDSRLLQEKAEKKRKEADEAAIRIASSEKRL